MSRGYAGRPALAIVERMARPAYVGLREAVALLEVKPATLYTYVSRGWVGRVPAEVTPPSQLARCAGASR